jgi:O-antigen/teichoic acid export membrane protein
MLTWPFYILVAIYASTLLGLFGSEYEIGAAAVVVLSISVLVGAGFGPVDILLVMMGKSSWSLWNTAAALAVNIALNLLLIPRIGIIGAAISLATSRIVANSLPLAQLIHLARLHPFGRRWINAVAMSSLTFALVGFLAHLFLGSTLGSFLAAVALGSVIYSLAVWRNRNALLGGEVNLAFGKPS